MYRFYPLLLLVCVLLVAGLGRDIGPMITVDKSYRSLNKTVQARNPAVTVELEGITANAPEYVNALAGMLEKMSIPGSVRGSVSSLEEVQDTNTCTRGDPNHYLRADTSYNFGRDYSLCTK